MTFIPRRDTRISLYNATESSLAFARQAASRARAGGADLKIRCSGDSLTAAQFASAPQTASYPYRVQQMLGASGLFGTARRGPIYGTDAANNQSTRDSRIAVGTGWGAGTNGYLAADWQGTAPAGFLTITPDQNVDTFVVTYAQYGATGSLTASVDGGSTTTHSFNGSAAVGVWTISAGSVGAHTLAIGATGAQAFVHMIDAYDSTQVGGVRVAKAGQPGVRVDVLAADYTYGGLSAAWAGYVPDIDIIMIGTNDAPGAGLAAGFVGYLTTAVQRARANNCDPILLVPIPAGPSYGGLNHPALVAAYYQVADAQNCALIDMDKRWLSDELKVAASPYLFMQGDLVHCTDKGYADIADAVARTLITAL